MSNKLKSVTFYKFDRFESEKIEIEIADNITCFVGPNGSGKSSLLESLAMVIGFFNHYHIQGPKQQLLEHLHIKKTTEPLWEEAVLLFDITDQLIIAEGKSLLQYRSAERAIKYIKLTIKNNHSNEECLTLYKIEFEDHNNENFLEITLDTDQNNIVIDSKRFNELTLEKNALDSRNEELAEPIRNMNQIKDKNSIQTQEMAHLHYILNQFRNNKYNHKITRINQLLDFYKKPNLFVFNNVKGDQLEKKDLEELIQSISIPKIIYIHQNNAIEMMLENYRIYLLQLSNIKGFSNNDSEFNREKKRLSDFLKQEVEPHGDKDNFTLEFDSLNKDQLSVGTYLALCFYSLTNQVDENGIIIWDEPENSMHPTRRIKLAELMKENNNRFVLGTHATEFTPVFDENSNIYKLHSEYQTGWEKPLCHIYQIDKSLTEAYNLTYLLGLEPSKVLFTSNCIIWVEGPSDKIYYSFWLKKLQELDDQESLLEGFDYSFMFTGGSSLKYLTLNDEIKDSNNNFVNVFKLIPTSIFIPDTDIEDPNVDDDFDQYSIKSFDNIQNYNTQLKNIHQACNNNGNGSCVLPTFGYTVENFISEKSLKDLFNIYKIDKNNIEKIQFSRWTNLKNIFIELNGINTNKQNIKYDKMGFAEKYLIYYEKNTFNLEECLMDKGEHIKKVADKIREIKKKYQ